MNGRLVSVYALSVVAMSALFVSSVWAMTVAGGGTHGEGLTLGAFAATWGGPGFGVMMAGMILALAGEHE